MYTKYFFRCVDFTNESIIFSRYLFECPEGNVFAQSIPACVPGVCPDTLTSISGEESPGSEGAAPGDAGSSGSDGSSAASSGSDGSASGSSGSDSSAGEGAGMGGEDSAVQVSIGQ